MDSTRPGACKEAVIMAINKRANTAIPFWSWFFSVGSQQLWHTRLEAWPWQCQPTHGWSEDKCSKGRLHVAQTKWLELPWGSVKPERDKVAPKVHSNCGTWLYPRPERPKRPMSEGSILIKKFKLPQRPRDSTKPGTYKALITATNKGAL